MTIKDKASLINAFKRLGGKWIEGATTYKWWGRHVGDWPIPAGLTVADMGRCHHKASFPGIDYEVGIIEIDKLPADHPARSAVDAEGVRVYADGSFVPIFDFIHYDLTQKLGGTDAAKLIQAYKLEQAKAKIKQQHRSARFIEHVDEKTGDIKLEATLS